MKALSKWLVSSIFVMSSDAYAITIDGDLNDWIGIPTGNSPNDWKPINTEIKFSEEDNDNSGYLNPGWGGQVYDAEAIYVTQDALNFYVAVVTGLSPSTTEYPAGDLAFDFGNNGIFEYGVVVKTDSQTSDALNGGLGNQSEVYRVNEWNFGLWNDNGSYKKSDHPTTVKSGIKLPGLAQLVYQEAVYNGNSLANNLGSYDGSHYLIEAKIAKSFFDASDLAKPFTVHWTMACANDSISVDPPATVPTPSVLPMLALGLTLMTKFRRNSYEKASKIDFNITNRV